MGKEEKDVLMPADSMTKAKKLVTGIKQLQEFFVKNPGASRDEVANFISHLSHMAYSKRTKLGSWESQVEHTNRINFRKDMWTWVEKNKSEEVKRWNLI